MIAATSTRDWSWSLAAAPPPGPPLGPRPNLGSPKVVPNTQLYFRISLGGRKHGKM